MLLAYAAQLEIASRGGGHSLGTILPPVMGPRFNARGILSPQTNPRLICITMVRRKIHFLDLITLSTDLKYCLKMVVLTLAQGVCSHSIIWGKWGFWLHLKSLTPPRQSLIPRKWSVTWIIAA